MIGLSEKGTPWGWDKFLPYVEEWFTTTNKKTLPLTGVYRPAREGGLQFLEVNLGKDN